MHGAGFGMGFPGFGFGWIVMVLFWVVIIAVAVYGIKIITERTGSSEKKTPETPEEILKARFARGEITENQYKDQLRLLKS